LKHVKDLSASIDTAAEEVLEDLSRPSQANHRTVDTDDLENYEPYINDQRITKAGTNVRGRIAISKEQLKKDESGNFNIAGHPKTSKTSDDTKERIEEKDVDIRRESRSKGRIYPRLSQSEPSPSPRIQQIHRHEAGPPNNSAQDKFSGTSTHENEIRNKEEQLPAMSSSYRRHSQCMGADIHIPSDISPSRYNSPNNYTYIQALSQGPRPSRSSTRFQRFINGRAIHQLNTSHTISAQSKYNMMLWMKSCNVDISRSTYLLSLQDSLHHRSLSRKLSHNNSHDETILPPLMDLNDEWCNGILLSAIVATIVMKYDRSQVKEVQRTVLL